MADDDQSVSVTGPHPLPAWPRGMPGWLAAAYCGIGIAILRIHGPKPVKIGQKRLVWLKEDLDKWLDGMSGKKSAPAPEENPWDAYVFGADEAPSEPKRRRSTNTEHIR